MGCRPVHGLDGFPKLTWGEPKAKSPGFMPPPAAAGFWKQLLRHSLNRPAQSACDKNYRIESFKVPEFGKVESDRRRIDKTAVFNAFDEPSNSAFESFF